MQRMSRRLLLVAGLLLALPWQAVAQNSDTRLGSATAEIVNNPITLSEVDPLRFGTLLPTAADGTVRILTDGTVINSNVFVRTPGNAGRWNVAGEANAFYTIQLPGNNEVSLDLDPAQGVDSMAVNAFQHDAGNFPRLSSTGDGTFNVGATLSVRSDQSPGSYSGLYQVTVAYD